MEEEVVKNITLKYILNLKLLVFLGEFLEL